MGDQGCGMAMPVDAGTMTYNGVAYRYTAERVEGDYPETSVDVWGLDGTYLGGMCEAANGATVLGWIVDAYTPEGGDSVAMGDWTLADRDSWDGACDMLRERRDSVCDAIDAATVPCPMLEECAAALTVMVRGLESAYEAWYANDGHGVEADAARAVGLALLANAE